MESSKLFLDGVPELLQEEELDSYFKKMKFGDKKARNEIISHNIKLVIYQVMKYFSNTSYELDELVSVGLIGLIKSVDTFDPIKGVRFSTYSSRCITNEIIVFMRNGKKYSNDIHLEQPIGEDENGKMLIDLLADESVNFVLEYEDEELNEIINLFVQRLPERDKMIMMKAFGFLGDGPMKKIDIARELGINQSWISQIIKRVIKQLRVELEAVGIIEMSKEAKLKLEKMGKRGATQTIYEYFAQYPRGQVDEMLLKLNDEERALLTLRYGEDLDHPVRSKEWNREKANQYSWGLLRKMKRLLANLNYVPRAEKSIKIKEELLEEKKLENGNRQGLFVNDEGLASHDGKVVSSSEENYAKKLGLSKKPHFRQYPDKKL